MCVPCPTPNKGPSHVSVAVASAVPPERNARIPINVLGSGTNGSAETMLCDKPDWVSPSAVRPSLRQRECLNLTLVTQHSMVTVVFWAFVHTVPCGTRLKDPHLVWQELCCRMLQINFVGQLLFG